MATFRQSGQWRTLAALGALGLALTLAVGCSSTPTTAQQSIDPLLGSRTPPGTVAAPPVATPGASAQTSNNTAVPVQPTSYSGSNPASLATNWQSPLGQPTPLTNGPPLLPAQTSVSQSVAPGGAPPNPNPRIEPVPNAQPSNTPPIAPIQNWQAPVSSAPPIVQTANSTPAVDYDKLLKDHGVYMQTQDQTPNGLHLTCYWKGPNNNIRIIEYPGPARDYPTAAQAILRDIDQQK